MTEESFWEAYETGLPVTLELLNNALYVRDELPKLDLPDDLRRRLQEVCERLLVIKHDAISELHAAGFAVDRPGLGLEVAVQRLRAIPRWLFHDLKPLHELVRTLRDAPRDGSDVGSAFVLLAESGANIYQAFWRFQKAVASLDLRPGAESPQGEDGLEGAGTREDEPNAPKDGGSMNYFDWESSIVTCPECAWSGRGKEEALGEVFEMGVERHCPRCNKKLGFVPHPTDEETLSDPRATDQDRKDAEAHLHRDKEFERTKLKVPEQLPDLNPVPSTLVWDFLEIPKTERYTVIRNGTEEIWREFAWYEGYDRFGEVAVVLQGRYGASLRDLEPTRASLDYLYGDRMTASSYVEQVRSDLARGAYVVRA